MTVRGHRVAGANVQALLKAPVLVTQRHSPRPGDTPAPAGPVLRRSRAQHASW